MAKVKYIKTKDNKIIVFSLLQQHSEFKGFDPVSAGFIVFGGAGFIATCECYGESVSLNLKSDTEVDTELARRQIIGDDY